MLGDMIIESRGKITDVRVLPSEGQQPCFEISFMANGKLLGVDTSEVGTYRSALMPTGVYHGKGQGVITTGEGAMITWTGEGVGKPKGRGMAASWRGAIYLETAAAQLARLNSMAVIFEYEVDEEGNTQAREFEWK